MRDLVAGVRAVVLWGAVLASGGACGGGMSERGGSARTIEGAGDAAMAALAGKRIYFGHQSVGGNIVQGIADLVASKPGLRLRLVGPGEPWPDSGGFFAHGPVGRNGEPASKTDDFAGQLAGGRAARLDVAFHKYCYIDLLDGTDAAAVFAHYRETMARLHGEYPGVTFVHVTAPLTIVQTGPKALVKRLIGRAPGGYADNIRREQFNQLMRREYAGREPLFDLAAAEATRSDGVREAFEFRGQRGLALLASYASDGRHLGEAGRRRVAEELLVTLASLPTREGR